MRVATSLAVVLTFVGLAHAMPRGESPEQVARRFYDAFVKGDVPTMTSCYSPTVKFKDEIFSFDDRKGVMGMWAILTDPAGGAKFRYEVLAVQGEVVTVKWIADYKFPATGRPVHNEITARLVIRDGLIVDHRDSFPWRTWAKQAFPLGTVSDVAPIRWVLKTAMRAFMHFKIATNERKAARPASAGLIDRLR